MGRDDGGERHGSVKKSPSSFFSLVFDAKLEMDARTTVEGGVAEVRLRR